MILSHMTNIGTIGGAVIGGVFALTGPVEMEHTVLQVVASAGICGLIMWILLKAQMARAERDETRRDQSEARLLEMTSKQVEIQTRTADVLSKLTEGIEKRNTLQSQQESNLHDLTKLLENRWCLMNDEQVLDMLDRRKRQIESGK